MAIDQINGSSGIDPSKITEGSKLRNHTHNKVDQSSEEQQSSGGDSLQISELAKYTNLAQEIPTPNEANIAEIQKAIEDGSYLTDTVIEETAERIADQLI